MENKFTRKYIKPGFKLFENQVYNVKRLIHKRRCILSDKCGGGKTASVLFAFSFLKEKGLMSNLLVLTPLSAFEKEVWKKDIVKFTTLTFISIDNLYKLVGNSEQKLNKALVQYDVVYGKHTHVKVVGKGKEGIRNLIARVALKQTTLFCVDEI